MTTGCAPSCYFPGGIRVEPKQDNAAFEAWAAEQDRPDGHPIIATIIGVVVIFIGMGSHTRPIATDDMAAVLGGITGVALLVWCVALAITIRHSSAGWKIGSFIVLFLAAALATSISARRAWEEAFRRDLTTLTEVKVTADGTFELPKGGDRGGFSHISMTYLKAMSDEAAARDKALKGLGLDRIADMQAIARDPDLLRDCERFNRNRSIVDDAGTRMQGHVDRLVRQVQASDMPTTVRDEMLRSIDTPAISVTLATSTATSREQLDEASKLCAILARRHWKAQGGTFVFTNTSDMNSYNSHVIRWNDLLRRAQNTQAQGRRDLAASQQKIRDALRQ